MILQERESRRRCLGQSHSHFLKNTISTGMSKWEGDKYDDSAGKSKWEGDNRGEDFTSSED